LSYPNYLRFEKRSYAAKITRPIPDAVYYYGISEGTYGFDLNYTNSYLHNSIVKQSGLESFLKEEILVKRT